MSFLRTIVFNNTSRRLRFLLPSGYAATPAIESDSYCLPPHVFITSTHVSPQQMCMYSTLSPNYLQAENSSGSSSSSLPSVPPPQQLPFSSQTLLITESGKKRLQSILSQGSYLRISVDGGGCSGFQYKFEIVEGTTFENDDILLQLSSEAKTCVVIDQTSLDILRGSTLDYEKELIRSAFRIIDNPQAEQGCSCGASFNVKID